jgi:hypothetical protein
MSWNGILRPSCGNKISTKSRSLIRTISSRREVE